MRLASAALTSLTVNGCRYTPTDKYPLQLSYPPIAHRHLADYMVGGYIYLYKGLMHFIMSSDIYIQI
jgi:hypothetical protein